MKILITSGGCKVPIDDVRSITNFSSGRFGIELAKAFLWTQPHQTSDQILVFREKGSVWLDDHWDEVYNSAGNIWHSEYKDYDGYLYVKNLIKEFQPDIIISAAAVSDYVLDKTEGKISSDNDELVIHLKKGEKVIKSFRELAPNALIVGFKLLVDATEEEINNAVNKVFANGVDLVVYNDLLRLRKGITDRRVYTQSNSYTTITIAWQLVNLLRNFKNYKK